MVKDGCFDDGNPISVRTRYQYVLWRFEPMLRKDDTRNVNSLCNDKNVVRTSAVDGEVGMYMQI
jgi:hypothetical protein